MGTRLYGRYEYSINSYLADSKRQASLPALFMLLQESALRHAETHGFGWEFMTKHDCFWALSRIKVRIEKYPQWQDSVSIETWCKKPDGLMARRDFEMFTDNSEKILSATSSWLVLNRERRLQRISEMADIFPIIDRNAMDSSVLNKLPIHGSGELTKSSLKTIPYSAMDMNGHVNNVMYLQWIIDEFPTGYIQNSDICEVEINYLQEAVAGQQYYTLVEKCFDDEYLCSIIRCSDSRELSRMKLKFKFSTS